MSKDRFAVWLPPEESEVTPSTFDATNFHRNYDDFSAFVVVHETAVFNFCYRMLGSTKMAESVAEKAFRDVCSQFPDASLVDVLSAARCRCRAQLFHSKPLKATAVNDIQQLFNQLPIPEREVMALRYGCQLNFTEMAAVLNSSCETVRHALRQGRWHAANLEQARLTSQN